MPRRRRPIWFLIRCTLVGAAFSIASAWSISFAEYAFRAAFSGVINSSVTHLQLVAPNGVARPVPVGYERRVGYERYLVFAESEVFTASTGLPTRRWPSWVPIPPDDPAEGTAALAYGWPFRSMKWTQSRTTVATGGRPSTTMSNHGTWWIKMPHLRVIALPLQPMWPGFIGNALVGLTLTLTLEWLWKRRTRLRGPGRCIACGYDLAGIESFVCPECGATQPTAPPPAHPLRSADGAAPATTAASASGEER